MPVIVRIGILPNVEVAQAAGLACDNGIVVDEYCRTSDADILAIGDCTNHPNPLLGKRLRLESVHNAQEQAKTAASTILGKLEAYAQIPWFWSDQYDVKLQIAGLNAGWERTTVRPGARAGSQSVWYWQGGRLLSVDAMNDPRAYMTAKRWIEAGHSPDPAAIADPASDLKALAWLFDQVPVGTPISIWS